MCWDFSGGQWLGICLAAQGTWPDPCSGSRDPTCRRPMSLRTLKPTCRNSRPWTPPPGFMHDVMITVQPNDKIIHALKDSCVLSVVITITLPLWLRGWRIRLPCERPGFDAWVGKMPWRRERLPTPVLWPGEFHELCSPWCQRVGHDWETFTPHPFIVVAIALQK